MSRFVCVLVTLCVAHSTALVEEEDTDIWPFGRLRKEQATESNGTGSCECLPWRSVYRSRGVDCGQGLEFITIPQWQKCEKNGGLAPGRGDVNCDVGYRSAQDYLDRGARPTVQSAARALRREYCNNFFMRIRASDCIREASNSDEAKWYGRSWCYVDASCPQLNGGGRLKGKGVSAKLCTENAQPGVPEGDSILAKKSLAELHRWRKQSGLRSSMGPLLVKMSYKYWGEFFQQAGFLDFALRRDVCPGGMEKECRLIETIRKQKCPGNAWVADVGNHDTHKIVLCGEQVWSFANNTCLSGCEMA